MNEASKMGVFVWKFCQRAHKKYIYYVYIV